MRAVGVEQHQREEHKRHGEAREQVSDHRLVRAHPRLRQQHARVLRVLRAHEVEACHYVAHRPCRADPLPGSPVALDYLLAQAFPPRHDLRIAPGERVSRTQGLPDRQERHKHRHGGEQRDQIIRIDPVGQPVFEPEVFYACAGHISNRAILTMMPTPDRSIPTATPNNISPRTSVNRGEMYVGEVNISMIVTRTGSEPRIAVLARASLAIARAFARIARRPRKTRERLFNVSARLPPVSRCTLSAMMKNRNSDTSMRLAMSHSSESRSRPSFMPASMPRNSTPIGSPISWPALTIASVIGRPARSARTIRSIASGNREMKRKTRFFPIRPVTKCGIKTPTATPIRRFGTRPNLAKAK